MSGLTDEELVRLPEAQAMYPYGPRERALAFARAVEAAVLERAAGLCDAADKSTHPAELADAIRALGVRP